MYNCYKNTARSPPSGPYHVARVDDNLSLWHDDGLAKTSRTTLAMASQHLSHSATVLDPSEPSDCLGTGVHPLQHNLSMYASRHSSSDSSCVPRASSGSVSVFVERLMSWMDAEIRTQVIGSATRAS
jgi:hypothetical protein